MTPEQSVRIYLAECALHAAVLSEGIADASVWIPLTSNIEIDKGMLRVLDQIAYRFAKLQDSLGEKVMPLILELAQEPVPSNATFAEKLNRLERIGAIPSADEWKKFRIVRNALAHEYPEDAVLRVSAINRFVHGAEDLNAFYVLIKKYIEVHFPSANEVKKSN
jgi:hypothetical protein